MKFIPKKNDVVDISAGTKTGRFTIDVQVKIKDGSRKVRIINGLPNTVATGIFARNSSLNILTIKNIRLPPGSVAATK